MQMMPLHRFFLPDVCPCCHILFSGKQKSVFPFSQRRKMEFPILAAATRILCGNPNSPIETFQLEMVFSQTKDFRSLPGL